MVDILHEGKLVSKPLLISDKEHQYNTSVNFYRKIKS